MRVSLALAFTERTRSALHCRVVVVANYRIVPEQLAAVCTIAAAQTFQKPLACLCADGRRMVLVMKHRPQLEARIGCGYANAVALSELLSLLESRMFVLIEHGPDMRP